MRGKVRMIQCVQETALCARTNVERIIINFPRSKVRDSIEGRTNMVCVSVGQQYPLKAIDAAAVEERFEGALASYARRTDDATELLQTFALQTGGEGGARLAHKAGVPTSPDTLLRLLHAMTDVPVRTPPASRLRAR